MGIYIKGMEMPCACVFCELYDGDLYWCQGAKKEVPYSPEDKRAKFCPLVPVPPHGRLIDADALIERIGFEARHYVVKDEFDKGRVAAWNNVIYAIREYAPTIIPAEEGE